MLKVKVFFDISTLDPNKITGIGVYMTKLIEHLSQDEALELCLVVKLSRFKKIQTLSKYLGKRVRIIWPWTGIFERSSCIYHGPDFNLNGSMFIRRVVTVHDLVIFEKKYNTPSFYLKGIKRVKKLFRSKVDSIIVNSHFTGAEIIKYFPELSTKIVVTHLGGDAYQDKVSLLDDVTMPPKDFLFFLGTIEKRKNVVTLIESFELLKKRGYPGKLVISGALGFENEVVINRLRKSPYFSDILYHKYLNIQSVCAHFKAARVFVFPSLYEGFGIPVLEAMSFGCPIVASDIPVLREIAGEAAIFVSPESSEEFCEALEGILNDEKLYQKMSSLSEAQAKLFTWRRCVERTVLVYQGVLGVRSN